MEDETKERWYQLAQLAAVEQDPERLVALAQEITRLLEEKEESIKQKRRVLVSSTLQAAIIRRLFCSLDSRATKASNN